MAFALYSVPASLGLAMVPHFVKMSILKTSNNYENGRPAVADVEAKLTKDQAALARRLQAAHQNGLESLPLFAGGVAACVAVNAPALAITRLCAVHLASRAVYYVVYALPPVANGAPRSLSYVVSVASSVLLWFTAAKHYSA